MNSPSEPPRSRFVDAALGSIASLAVMLALHGLSALGLPLGDKIAVVVASTVAAALAGLGGGIAGWVVAIVYALFLLIDRPGPGDWPPVIAAALTALLPVGVIGMLRQDSARRQRVTDAERASTQKRVNRLERVASHDHQLLDSAPVLIVRFDAAGTPIYFNKAWLSWRGTTLEQELAVPFPAQFHPEDLREPPDRLALTAGAANAQCEARLRRSDGSYGWVRLRSLPLAGPDGTVESVTAVGTEITELHRATELVRSSEQAVRGLLRAIPDLIFRIRGDGIYVGYSGPSDASVLAPVDRFIGHHVTEILPADVAGRTLRAISETLSTNRPSVFEYSTGDRDAQKFWESRIVVSGADEVLCIVRDITDRRRSEQALQRQLRLFLEGPVVVWQWKNAPRWPVSYVSPNVSHFGYRPEDFAQGGLVFADIVHPDDLVRVGEEVANFVKNHQTTFEQHYRLRTADGRWRWIADYTTIDWGPDGTPLGFAGYIVDEHERYEALQALHDSEERLRLQFERMPMALIVIDMRPDQPKIVQWNPGAQRIFGWTAEEAVGREALPLVVHPSARSHVDRIIARIRAGDMDASSRNLNITKDGRTITCEWFNTPVRDATGRVVELITMAQDVTERVRMEEELRQSQKMDAVGQLASGVAHDFNNLLTAIFGFTTLARRTLAPQHPANSALDRVEEAARQASGVTKALLTFSRDKHADKRPIHLARAVHEAVRLLRRTLPAGIDLVTRYDIDAPLWVMGEATQIQQIVLNLAINARDAMPDGGRLSITVERRGEPDDPHAALIVTDTGVGMTPEVAARIFEPFFTTKPPEHGTGLGLSIVHGIVRDHGGKVDVATERFRGTTFTIRFPVTAAPPPEPAQGAATTPAGVGQLILLADDYTYVREIVASMILNLGYRVVQAPDARTLMDAAREHGTDARLIVIDHDMPGMSGLECLNAMRHAGDSTPAILMTGNTAALEPPEGVEVLRKPFQMHELAAAIGRALHQPAAAAAPTMDHP